MFVKIVGGSIMEQLTPQLIMPTWTQVFLLLQTRVPQSPPMGKKDSYRVCQELRCPIAAGQGQKETLRAGLA